MTSLKDALRKVLKNVKVKTQIKHIKNIKKGSLAEDIKSKRDNPYYNNSLLDGFAFRASDTKKNHSFKINGELAVGENKKIRYQKNTCYRISTGGKIIPPYDCMLPYEKVTVANGIVKIPCAIKKLTNIRLTDQSVALIIKEYLTKAGIDNKNYSGHSLRSGFATSAAEAGAEERSIMAMTGHKSTEMVRRYIKEASLFKNNALNKIKL